MTYQNKSCADACASCIPIAAACAIDCIEGDRDTCAKHCLECVEICKTMVVLAARDSMNLAAAADACSTICEACAEECENHDNAHCNACAEACRKCAEECRQLAGNA